MKNVDMYLIKAMDEYPWRLADAMESIQYALSYNDQNPHTLLLAGRIYAEEFEDYIEAIKYYEEGMAADLDTHKIYPYLIDAYLNLNQLDKAKKLIKYALKKDGVDRALIITKKIRLFEMEGNFRSANGYLDLLKLEVIDCRWKTWITEAEARLKTKLNLAQKYKKKWSKATKKSCK